MDETRGTPGGSDAHRTPGGSNADRTPGSSDARQTPGPGQDPEPTRSPADTAPSGTTSTPASTSDGKRGRGRRLLWTVLAVVLAFLVGFGWQYYRAMGIEESLEATERELAVERLRLGLAQATLAAQTGEFEIARREMSEFFNSAQEQLGELPPDLQQTLREILTMRDDVITGLSRSNPEYAGVLYGFLDRFRSATDDAPAASPPDTAG